MNETPATFLISGRIYWSLFWLSVIIGLPVFFITGMITALLFSSLGEGANTAARIATFLSMIPVQIFCIYMVIGKTFGKHKLVLLDCSVDA